MEKVWTGLRVKVEMVELMGQGTVSCSALPRGQFED